MAVADAATARVAALFAQSLMTRAGAVLKIASQHGLTSELLQHSLPLLVDELVAAQQELAVANALEFDQMMQLHELVGRVRMLFMKHQSMMLMPEVLKQPDYIAAATLAKQSRESLSQGDSAEALRLARDGLHSFLREVHRQPHINHAKSLALWDTEVGYSLLDTIDNAGGDSHACRQELDLLIALENGAYDKAEQAAATGDYFAAWRFASSAEASFVDFTGPPALTAVAETLSVKAEALRSACWLKALPGLADDVSITVADIGLAKIAFDSESNMRTLGPGREGNRMWAALHTEVRSRDVAPELLDSLLKMTDIAELKAGHVSRILVCEPQGYGLSVLTPDFPFERFSPAFRPGWRPVPEWAVTGSGCDLWFKVDANLVDWLRNTLPVGRKLVLRLKMRGFARAIGRVLLLWRAARERVNAPGGAGAVTAR
tara:strand:+ start:172 stop:1467 length:1296 start_codon:yes stop_codon:yes gene_type:complete